ncbi:hypothetical protein [Brevibacterium iodinum]|nr:hypothetical protein [Brevibacterium iodinum]
MMTTTEKFFALGPVAEEKTAIEERFGTVVWNNAAGANVELKSGERHQFAGLCIEKKDEATRWPAEYETQYAVVDGALQVQLETIQRRGLMQRKVTV